jgi:hypothetical protein
VPYSQIVPERSVVPWVTPGDVEFMHSPAPEYILPGHSIVDVVWLKREKLHAFLRFDDVIIDSLGKPLARLWRDRVTGTEQADLNQSWSGFALQQLAWQQRIQQQAQRLFGPANAYEPIDAVHVTLNSGTGGALLATDAVAAHPTPLDVARRRLAEMADAEQAPRRIKPTTVLAVFISGQNNGTGNGRAVRGKDTR